MLAAAVLTAVLLFSSCSLNIGVNGFHSYADGQNYTVGDRIITDEIDSVEIVWLAGGLTVQFAPGNSIEITEKNSPADDRYKVHSYVDGKTLKIQYVESAAPGLPSSTLRKSLTVVLPDSIVYETFSVNTSSSDLECLGVNAKSLEILSASGTMTVEGKAENAEFLSASGKISFTGECSGKLIGEAASGDIHITSSAASIELSALSGDINLVQLGNTSSVSLETQSGRITVNTAKVTSVKAGTGSGSMELRAAEAEEITASTLSGSMHIGVTAMPERIKTSSSSGSITLSMPSDAGFSAEIGKTSGSVTTDFPVRTEGKKLVCGNGAADIRISTGSGNIRLKTEW